MGNNWALKMWVVCCLLSVLLTEYCSGGQIKKDEMGGTCGTYGREEKCIQGIGGETRKKSLGTP